MANENGQPAESPSAGEGQVDLQSGADENLASDQNPQGDTDVNPSSDASSGSEPGQDVNSDLSSEDQDVKDKEPENLLDAVTKAVAKQDEGKKEEASTSGTEKSKDQAGSDQDGSGQNDSDDEFKDLDGKPVPYERFKEVLTKRNEYREQVGALNQQIDTLRPQAEGFENFRNYMQERGVSGNDAVRALDIIGLMNSDPEKAFSQLSEIYEDLGVGLGKLLPRDIQSKVDTGEITEELGKELALRRAGERSSRQSLDTTKAQETFRQNQAAEQNQNQVKQSVNAWDAQKLKSDPLYAAKDGRKRQLVKDRIVSIVRTQGQPRNAQEYVKIADEAYNYVSETFSAQAPKRPAKTPSPSSSGTQSQSNAAPKTMLEAVKLGASQSQ